MDSIRRVGGTVVDTGATERDVSLGVALHDCLVLRGIKESRFVVRRAGFHALHESHHDSTVCVVGLAVGCLFALGDDSWVMLGKLCFGWDDASCSNHCQCQCAEHESHVDGLLTGRSGVVYEGEGMEIERGDNCDEDVDYDGRAMGPRILIHFWKLF